MATSGSWDYSPQRSALIQVSIQMVGGLGLGETASSDQISQASYLLNGIIKNWHSMGMPTWCMKFYYILPATGVSGALIGPNSTAVTTSYVHTNAAADITSGGTTLTVDSASGISANYNLAVEREDGTIQFTSVSGSPVGNVITTADTLTADIADGDHVYAFADAAIPPRALKVHGAWRRNQDAQTDVPLTQLTRDEYMNLSSKTTTGVPIQYYYDPQQTDGTFYWWPRHSNADEVIVISVQEPFEDMDADANELDFPPEWVLPITWELAYNLAPFYGIPPDERRIMRQEAEYFFNKVAGWDQEEGSIYLQPSERVG